MSSTPYSRGSKWNSQRNNNVNKYGFYLNQLKASRPNPADFNFWILHGIDCSRNFNRCGLYSYSISETIKMRSNDETIDDDSEFIPNTNMQTHWKSKWKSKHHKDGNGKLCHVIWQIYFKMVEITFNKPKRLMESDFSLFQLFSCEVGKLLVAHWKNHFWIRN